MHIPYVISESFRLWQRVSQEHPIHEILEPLLDLLLLPGFLGVHGIPGHAVDPKGHQERQGIHSVILGQGTTVSSDAGHLVEQAEPLVVTCLFSEAAGIVAFKNSLSTSIDRLRHATIPK